MVAFLRNLKDKFSLKKDDDINKSINESYKLLKEIYDYNSISEERKEVLKNLIENNGYLPYPHIKALEELSEAEVLYGLEFKWKNSGVMNENGEFSFNNDQISPAKRAGYTDGTWLTREQHNIKLINLAGLGNGNKTKDTGKFIDWLRQVLILPTGNEKAKILSTTIYLIPFHPREFGCAYLPTSSDVSPNLEDKELTQKLDLSTKQQVQLFIKLAQLAGHCVIYDVLPQTGRFSKMVLSNPAVARWFDINELISKIEREADNAAERIKHETDYEAEDVDVVRDIYKKTLKKGSHPLSEHYQNIYDKLEDFVIEKKIEFSNTMMKKENQLKIQERAKALIFKLNKLTEKQKAIESDITKQSDTIRALIEEGLWPAPGGAWCSSMTPIFTKMSESGEYPIFKHYDYKGEDVTHFANLDCQTPFYFVYLESGEYNHEVIDMYVDFLKDLQKDYNFDGFRVDHIDHIVDRVSENDGVPISYRAPRCVLGIANKEMKRTVPHFATLAEYMLWDKFYKEYHEDMAFDILWGNDIISQFSKNPQEIVNNNQELEQFNSETSSPTNMSILKTYNNQDGEFRAIDQYPGQLGEEGALFKWFKYKFLTGGKNAQRPVMFIDGDESFTKTGIEKVIGSEISMKRAKNYSFFNKFNAINKFALENELTREGESQIVTQHDDGFVAWMVSKNPLKQSLLVVANYQAPTEKISEDSNTYTTNGQSIFDKSVELPCDCEIVGEYVYKDGKIGEGVFEEVKFEKPQSVIHFGELKPSEFKIYKVKRA